MKKAPLYEGDNFVQRCFCVVQELFLCRVEFWLCKEENQDDDGCAEQHIKHIPELPVHDARDGDDAAERNDGGDAVEHPDCTCNGGADGACDPCAAEVLAREGDSTLRDACRREEEGGDAELTVCRIIAVAQDKGGKSHSEWGNGAAHTEHAVWSENPLCHQCEGKCCCCLAARTAKICCCEEPDTDAEGECAGTIQLIHDMDHELNECIQRDGQQVNIENTQDECRHQRDDEGRHHGLQHLGDSDFLHPADKVTDEEAEEESPEEARSDVGLAHWGVGGVAEDKARSDCRLTADGISDVGAEHGHHHGKSCHAEIVYILPELIARDDAAVLHRACDEGKGEHHTTGDDDRQEVGDTCVEIAKQFHAEAGFSLRGRACRAGSRGMRLLPGNSM